MSRNGSGTFTKINTFTSGTPVTASAHNQNFDDIALEITNSVAADGQTTMTGPLKASNGSVTNPSVTFGSDQNTGRYRKSADVMADVCNGAEVFEYSAIGIDVTGEVNATTVKQAGFAVLPVGLGPLPWSGSSAPEGWILCYGQALSRSSYSALWAFAETEIAASNALYGVGDGSTTFTVADLRGRVVAGQDDMGGTSANRLTNADDGLNGDTLGATGGGETQTLVTANLPAYTPAGTNGNISVTSTTSLVQVNGSGTTLGGGGSTSNPITNSTGLTSTGSGPTFTGTPQGGTSTAFGIVQPTITANMIIFAGV